MKADIESVSILNVPIHPYTMDGAVKFLETALSSKNQTLVVTANAEIVMLAKENAEYGKLLTDEAGVVLPDGAGVVWAGRHCGYDVSERVAGYDLFNRLLSLSSQKGYKCFFFGGQADVVETAVKKANELYPNVKIVGYHHGYFKQDESKEIVKIINNSGAEILFVALGAPKQEYWLSEFKDKLQCTVLMGIGGSFDVLAGKVQRAPLWMQKMSLEWLYRLLKQPSRFVRMLVLPKFVWQVCFEKNKKGE